MCRSLEGIVRGRVHVVPDFIIPPPSPDLVQVCLDTSTAWGDGHHPSTALCLDFLSNASIEKASVLDYGCGSGVLAIAAFKLGASRVVGVDIDDEILEAADANVRRNGATVALRHGREVVPGDETFEMCLANILVGQLSRPSMVAALALALEPEGVLCLSGLRPGDQCATVTQAYEPSFDFLDDEAAVLEHPTWGAWARLVGRRKRRLPRYDDVFG